MLTNNHTLRAGPCGTAQLLICVALVAASAPARADLFEAVPVLEVAALHETNPRLQNDDEDDATGLVLDGRLDMRWDNGRTSLDLDPRARFSFYADSDDNDLEDEDFWINSLLAHKTALSEYTLNTRYSTVGVRSSEVESAGDSSGTGSGTIRRADDSRQTFTIGPGWSRQFGARNLVSISGSYTDVDFDKNTLQTSRLPYEYWDGRTSFQRSLNPKLQAGIQLELARFESKASGAASIENTSDTYGASLFTNYSFSETLSGSAYFGARNTDIELKRQQVGTLPDGSPLCLSAGIFVVPCTENTDDVNFVGSASLTQESERTTYDLSISRAVTPNSNGGEQIRDSVDLVASRQLTERMTGSIGVLYFGQEDVADLTNRDSTYVSARLGLSWRLARYWSLFGAYRYVNDDDENLNGTNDDATNHYFYLGVRYRGQGWRR